MKKHLNTLYITSDDAFLRKERETFVVEVRNEKVFQAPIHSIEGIVCFGFKPITPSLMAVCAENSVSISYLSENGQFLASVRGAQQGNVLLRKAQYSMADDESLSLTIAKPIVAAKVSNYRNILLRNLRNHPDNEGNENISRIADILGKRLLDIEKAENLDNLRGYEGECASHYFSIISYLITAQREDFEFAKRSKRPPLDPANAILSFLYAILANDVRSSLETIGLDPQVGFLHRLRSGRPSLALDIMEELRAYLGDRVMLNLINLKQVNKTGFEIKESGEVRMTDYTRKTVLQAYQQKKQEEIIHPFLEEKVTIGLLPHIQSQLLARYIRGDMEFYPPLTLK